VQQERIETLNKNKEQLQSLYREGRVAKVDLLKIDDVIVEAETAVIATNNNVDKVLQRLADDLALEQGVALDERFVYYLLGSTGICVVPLTGFASNRNGFRLTLLETDNEKRVQTWQSIAENIRRYLSS
jgi:aspartate/methionine/tyrosine aminotransferase